MATSRSTMSAGARPIHPSLAKAAIAAAAAQAEVRAAAEYLAKAMERVHGGNWRIQIDHEEEFAMVARRLPKGRATPKPEVA